MVDGLERRRLSCQAYGPVLVLSIDRPEVRNAIDLATARAIEAEIDRFEADGNLRVAIITGSATVFSAGADLKAAAREGVLPRGERRGWFGLLEQLPAKPVIAAVEGLALGGGLEIALACDLIVASRTSAFGLPEVRRGVIASAGGLFRLPQRLPRNLAMEMVLTGEPWPAERLQALGLINHLCEPGQALTQARALAERIAQQAPLSVQASVTVVRTCAGRGDEAGWALQAPSIEALRRSADYRESVDAFARGRQPVWRGC
ncbi:MAG: crotonase/enoyl-CoA hydratase family protein [Ottowia sp.]|uniref:crotonase/enoyl-CoA hydratase family protein n=1 Tax=Ottowia sp. TaxID=1898956 RepID=UPI003C76B954